MTNDLIYYSPWTYNIQDTAKLVFLVGMCPGRQRISARNFLALQGNKTGDLVSEAIQGIPNIYLTNIFNVLTKNPTKEMIARGLFKLKEDIADLEPVKIVLLGRWTEEQFLKLELDKPYIALEHPSFILRFNKDKAEYLMRLRAAITV